MRVSAKAQEPSPGALSEQECADGIPLAAVAHAPAVAVVAMTNERRIVLMRPAGAAERRDTGTAGWLLPRGTLEAGEAASQAARRTYERALGVPVDERLVRQLGRVRLGGRTGPRDITYFWAPATGLARGAAAAPVLPDAAIASFSLTELRQSLRDNARADGYLFAALGLLLTHGLL